MEVRKATGVVTSHGCDNEDYFREKEKKEDGDPEVVGTYPVHVAPLRPAEHFRDGGKLGDIQGGRVRRFFFLPEEADQPAFVVDLLHEQAVPAVLLESLKCDRRLTDEMWDRLLVHMWVRRSRKQPEDVFVDGAG